MYKTTGKMFAESPLKGLNTIVELTIRALRNSLKLVQAL